jgi:hypothetical protein
MLKVRSLFGVAAALIVTPLMGMPASATTVACPVASFTFYNSTFGTGSGNACTVDGLTFSDMLIKPNITGIATISDITVAPFTTTFNGATEVGLELLFSASAESGKNPDGTPILSVADIAWTYNVAGNFINDVFASITGSTTGTGAIALSETLTNGVVLQLSQSGVTGQTFSPTSFLGVTKDEFARAGLDGFAADSVVQNGFSLVPAPIVGAGMPGLMAACVGLIGLARRRRRRQVV